GMPDQTLIIALDSEDRYTIAKGALKPEEAAARARGYEAKREIAMQPGEVMSISQAVSAMLLRGESPANVAGAVVGGKYAPAEMPRLLCAVSNVLLDTYAKQRSIGPTLKQFYRSVITQSQGLDKEYAPQARNLSLIAAQALIIMSWMDNSAVPNAAAFRLTDVPDAMVKSPDVPGRGGSFLDLRSMGLGQAAAEGREGIYFRGTEAIEKMSEKKTAETGRNISEAAVYDASFNQMKSNVVLYAMDHGFLPVPPMLVALTNNDTISTIHETFFITDLLPMSYQYASTGPGHFQGLAFDIKYVTEGTGIQYNKIYDENGKLVKVIAQPLKPGSWAIALPGAVDSIENLGSLKFNDFTVKITPRQAARINPYFNFTRIEAAKPAIEASLKTVPYFAVKTVDAENREAVNLVRNEAAAPDITWVNGIPANAVNASSAIDLYNNLDETRLAQLIEAVAPVTSGRAWEISKAPIALMPVERLALMASRKPMTWSSPASYVYQYYAWGGYGISAFLGMKEQAKIAELWINSVQKDGLTQVPGTAVTLAELINASPEKMLGPGMTAKPVFSKILGKDETQPQIVQLGFNQKIKEVGKETFIKWLVEERKLVTELKNALAALSMSEKQFAEYAAAYEKWVSDQVKAQWKSAELPKLPAFMAKFDTAVFERIRKVRSDIVSVMNEIKLAPGQTIIAPVGYIHSIVGSHQTHPPATSSETKSEAWYIFSAGKNEQGRDRLLYFEPQQTSNTTYSPFDFPTPIVWMDGKPQMRKDLRKGLEAILKPGEAAPRTEDEAIRIMAERALIFEPTKPEDFLTNERAADVTGSDLYGDPARTKVEALIEGTYPVWPNELFTLHRIEMNGQGARSPASVTVNPVENVYHELIVLRGNVGISSGGETTRLGQGASVFVPADHKIPYKLESEGEAEVMRLYPRAARKPGEAVAKLSLEEVQDVIKGETGALGETLKSAREKADPKEGVVVIGIDDNLYRSFAVSVGTELPRLIQRAFAPDSVIVVRGKGDQLVGKIQEAVDATKAKGYKVRSVVTQINAQTSADIKSDLAKLGVVLNVNLKGRNIETNYIQFVRLMDLSIKIAYDYQPEDIRATLARIVGPHITMFYIMEMLVRRVIDILPQIMPVDASVSSQAYKRAKQALEAL
ncbi:MAG: hypothetical protein JW919_01860, partial [Candidatus Omnitrophica bacterium]|nr:hypothetical protein [Candidatus Omnitrophota bacterium]